MQNYTVHATGFRDFEKTCSRDLIVKEKPIIQTLPTYQEYTSVARSEYDLDEVGFVVEYNPFKSSSLFSEHDHFMRLEQDEVPIRQGIYAKFYPGNETETISNLKSSKVDYIIGSTLKLGDLSSKAHLQTICRDIEMYQELYDVYAGLLELDDRYYLWEAELLERIFKRLKELGKGILVNANKPINPNILKMYKEVFCTYSEASRRLNEKLKGIQEVSGFSYVPKDIVEAEEAEYRKLQSGIIVGNDAHQVYELNTNLRPTLNFLKQEGIRPSGYCKRNVMLPHLNVNR